MRRLIRLLLVASVLYGTGAHWAALQSAAWAGMIAARVGESSMTEVVASVFSGEKPCGVCKVVEKGSTSDQSSLPLRSGPSLELAFSEGGAAVFTLTQSGVAVCSFQFGSALSPDPVVPPPIVALPV